MDGQLSLFLCLVFVTSALGASFVGEVDTLTKTIGEDAELSCKVKDYEGVNIVWYRHGDYEAEMIALGEMKVIEDKNLRVTIATEANVATSTVSIKGLKMSDFGVYECAIQGSETAEKRSKGGIQRMETNLPAPSLSISQEPKSPKAGGQVKLSCHVGNFAGNSMMWFKLPERSDLSADMISAGPMVLMEQNKYVVTLTQQADSALYTLVIKSLQAKDAGTYKCQSQIVGQAWDENPSATVKLSIQNTGGPKPTDPPNRTTTPRPTTPPIQILPASITNSIGVISVVQGSDVNLDCVVKNHKGHEVTWSKMLNKYAHIISKGKEIVHEDRHGYKLVVKGDTYRLTIKSATSEDGGKYRCTVFGNKDGRTPMIEGYLLTEPKPSNKGVSIQNSLGVKDAEVGSTAVFSCEVRNLGTAPIFWMFAADNSHSLTAIAMGPFIFSPDEKYSVTTTVVDDVTISNLNIADVTVKEEGIYRCIVQVPSIKDYDAFPKSDGFLSVV